LIHVVEVDDELEVDVDSDDVADVEACALRVAGALASVGRSTVLTLPSDHRTTTPRTSEGVLSATASTLQAYVTSVSPHWILSPIRPDGQLSTLADCIARALMVVTSNAVAAPSSATRVRVVGLDRMSRLLSWVRGARVRRLAAPALAIPSLAASPDSQAGDTPAAKH
jgi:hypothetical protein